MDAVYVFLAACFFAATWGMVRLCASLGDGRGRTEGGR